MHRVTQLLSTLFTACAATVLCASPAHATRYVFTEGGFTDGATLSGSFTATDANGSGAIEYDIGNPANQDVTDFTATFSGNSVVSAFTFSFSDLAALEYDQKGLYFFPGFLEFLAGSATNVSFISIFVPCNGTDACGVVIDTNSNTDISIALPTTSAPEPATWAMMLVGFGMVGGALRASRRIGDKRQEMPMPA